MHQILLNDFFLKIIQYLPIFIGGATIAYGYFKSRSVSILNDYELKEKKIVYLLKKLIIWFIAFKTLYILFLTAGQFFIWKSDSFTSYFLKFGVPKIKGTALQYLPSFFEKELGYFLYYTFFRFWLEFIIALFLSYCFYLCLNFLMKYNERFLSKSDSMLGFLGGIVSGWPGFTVYFFSFLLIFVFWGFYQRFLKKSAYASITLPLWISAFLGGAFSGFILRFVGLGFLFISA
jgi:hypothetical protein